MSAPLGRSKRVVRGFVLRFAAWLFLGSLAYTLTWDTAAVNRYLELVAGAVALLLAPFVDGLERSGATIASSRFALTVDHGCDALLSSACFVSGVLAQATDWRRKAIGLAVGLPLLQLVNLVRIASLFAIGALFPERFAFAHETLWEWLFLVAVVVVWVAWTRWAVPATERAGPRR